MKIKVEFSSRSTRGRSRKGSSKYLENSKPKAKKWNNSYG
jgi:hypothetical protein